MMNPDTRQSTPREECRRWSDQALHDIKNDLTMHTAKEELRDQHYSEAIVDLKDQIGETRKEVKEIKDQVLAIRLLIEHGRGGISASHVWVAIVLSITAFGGWVLERFGALP